MPSGIANRTATPTAAPVSARCWAVLEPNRLRLLKKKVTGSLERIFLSPGQAAPAPRRDRTLDEHQHDVGDDGQQDGQRAGGDELGFETALDGIEDQRP